MTNAPIVKNLRIFGRVQGVYYRAWCAQTAQTMGLTGWVRNRKDGSVEALIIGDESRITRFISSCYQGPKSAKVETITVTDSISPPVKGFDIRETY